ncbi:MAG TPA: hypothetical protein VEQ60_08335, partial [Longimicrobium sp.]|nr:hypothetical protein [Longimicrobium sp.]
LESWAPGRLKRQSQTKRMSHAAAHPPNPELGVRLAVEEPLDGLPFIRVHLILTAADVDGDEVPQILSTQLLRDRALEHGFAEVGDLVPGIVRLDHDGEANQARIAVQAAGKPIHSSQLQ